MENPKVSKSTFEILLDKIKELKVESESGRENSLLNKLESKVKCCIFLKIL